jgi:5'-methylthioadenosine phosphorylase
MSKSKGYAMPEIGIIGGSGVYSMEGLEDLREVWVETPFGAPSDLFLIGRLGQTEIAFLARHGRAHRIDPSHLPYRANIYGFKELGVRRILSVSAVGSLREDIAPEDVVIPDQFYDRTRGRVSSFVGDGVVAHVSFADPLCPHMAGLLLEAAREEGVRAHQGGTYVCMEGPAFSTRAESRTYRRTIDNAAVIGMTNLQEAKLSREAEICYATLALVTDYDCWHEEEADVTTDAVIAVLKRNAAAARRILGAVVGRVDLTRICSCEEALGKALLTPLEAIDDRDQSKYLALLKRFIKP